MSKVRHKLSNTYEFYFKRSAESNRTFLQDKKIKAYYLIENEKCIIITFLLISLILLTVFYINYQATVERYGESYLSDFFVGQQKRTSYKEIPNKDKVTIQDTNTPQHIHKDESTLIFSGYMSDFFFHTNCVNRCMNVGESNKDILEYYNSERYENLFKKRNCLFGYFKLIKPIDSGFNITDFHTFFEWIYQRKFYDSDTTHTKPSTSGHLPYVVVHSPIKDSSLWRAIYLNNGNLFHVNPLLNFDLNITSDNDSNDINDLLFSVLLIFSYMKHGDYCTNNENTKFSQMLKTLEGLVMQNSDKSKEQPTKIVNEVIQIKYHEVVELTSKAMYFFIRKNHILFLDRYINVKENIIKLFMDNKQEMTNPECLDYKRNLIDKDTHSSDFSPYKKENMTINSRFFNLVNFYYHTSGYLHDSLWSAFYGINDDTYIAKLKTCTQNSNKNDGTNQESNSIKEDVSLIQDIKKFKKLAGKIGDFLFSTLQYNIDVTNLYSDSRVSDMQIYYKNTQLRNINTMKYMTEKVSLEYNDKSSESGNMLLILDKTRLDIFGDMIQISKNLLIDILEEIKRQVESIEIGMEIYKTAYSQPLNACVCGFHLGILENVVYVTKRNKGTNKHSTEMYIKPRVMERNSKLKVSEFDSIPFLWEMSFYEYNTLNRFIENVHKITIDQINRVRKEMSKTGGKTNTVKNEKHESLVGSLGILESMSDFNRIMESNPEIKEYLNTLYTMPSFDRESFGGKKSPDIVFDEKIITHEFLLEYFGVDEYDHVFSDYYSKMFKKSNDHFTLFCVDYCTLSWGIMSETAHYRYQKHSINSVYENYGENGNLKGMCNLKKNDTCTNKWGYTSNKNKK